MIRNLYINIFKSRFLSSYQIFGFVWSLMLLQIAIPAIADSDSQISAGVFAESPAISSLVDEVGEEIVVFDFQFTDVGTSDGLPTTIDTIEIRKGDLNGVVDWTKAIGAAYLVGPAFAQPLSGTILNNIIAFSVLGQISIPDGGSETYELHILLKQDLSGITDNDVLEFKVENTGIITNPGGSSFGPGTTESGNTNNRIDIVATNLAFNSGYPPEFVPASSDFPIGVGAVDINGNLDVDATNSVALILNTGGGAMSSVTGLSQNLVGGIYLWTDVQYNTPGTFTIKAQNATLTDTISNQITALNATVFTVGASGTHANIQSAYNAVVSAVPIATPYLIEILSDYNPAGEVIPLTFNPAGTNTNKVVIRPKIGVGPKVISGDPGSGSALVQFNGASHVVLDGRPGGGGSDRITTLFVLVPAGLNVRGITSPAGL